MEFNVTTTTYGSSGGSDGVTEMFVTWKYSNGTVITKQWTLPSNTNILDKQMQTLKGGCPDVENGLIGIYDDPFEEVISDKLSLSRDNNPEVWEWLNKDGHPGVSQWELLKLDIYLSENTDEQGVVSPEAQELANEIIDSELDNTLVNIFPFFKYPEGSNYSVLYPKTTKYLSEQIPKAINNSSIIQNIMEITGLTQEQISNDLMWGKGPVINFKQLDNYQGCPSCNDLTAALFDPNFPDKVFIDMDFVNLIESDNLSVEDSNNLQLFFVSSLLHEYVHLGDNIDGKDYPGEEGSLFEIRVWGVDYANSLRKFYVNLIRK